MPWLWFLLKQSCLNPTVVSAGIPPEAHSTMSVCKEQHWGVEVHSGPENCDPVYLGQGWSGWICQ